MTGGARNLGERVAAAPGDGVARGWNPELPSVLTLVNAVVQGRRLVVVSALAAVLVVSLVTVATPRLYTATGAFVPIQDTDDGGSLGGLVSAVGLGRNVAAIASSLDYYVVLLRSRVVLEAVVADTYVVPVGAEVRVGNIVTLLALDHLGRERAEQEAVRRLEQALSTAADPRTGMVRIYVRTRWAGLSQQLAAHLLTRLDAIVAQTGAQAAAAEVRFEDEQVRQAREELHLAEAALQSFLGRNRTFSPSSGLGLEFARLQRDISMRQATYLSVYQAWSRASLRAARRTAALVVVEHPVVPPTGDPSRLWTNLAFGLVLGLTAGLSAALIREFARPPHLGPSVTLPQPPNLGAGISRPVEGPTGPQRPHQA